jgi:Zinc carboxypeptidase
MGVNVRMRLVLLVFLLASVLSTLNAQSRITTPKEQFGFNIGDDYLLVNYTQYETYLKKLAQESDRLTVLNIGKSSEGRPIYAGIITSPENFKKLDRLKEIARRLSRAEGVTDEQAKALAAEGKSIVWIDGGLHATEVLGAQQLIELQYQLASGNDPETLRLLNDDIVITCLVNPDGMELVSNWYMREPEPTKRSTVGIPVLYNKYASHDDNRDFYMVNLSESDAINRILYREFYPVIMYNHHQSGPAGTVMFSPPFRDPFNFNFDPLVLSELDEVAGAMHSRFIAENKPGVTMRSNANYSTWYNGGLRTTTYFHNIVGILTESIGNPTPQEIPLIFRQQLPRQDLMYPVAPQLWHFRQSIEYSITANRAVLDYASRHKDQILYNQYLMGKNSIERGSRDSWTISPHRLNAVEARANADREQTQRASGSGTAAGQRGGNLTGEAAKKYWDLLHDPKIRDPRGYVIPSQQPDFLTAIKFLNALIKNGIEIQHVDAEFSINGKTYAAGSYVVKTNQAYRPHVLDMFEPQDHPDDFAYPGAPPTRPYDNTGWTLAYMMGVKFDRILDSFECPCRKLPIEEIKPVAGKITQATAPAGYLLSHEVTDSFVAVNRLLNSSEDVYWVRNAFTANGKKWPAGAHFIPAKPSTLPKLEKLAADIGLSFEAVDVKPPGEALMLRPLRIGLVDRYGGSMPSGWIRYELEKFEFPFTLVFPPTLDQGNLAQKFDVIIVPSDVIPAAGAAAAGSDAPPAAGTNPQNAPAEYRDRVGTITAAKTYPLLKKFMEDGGALLSIGNASSLAVQMGLPLANALIEKSPDGKETPLPGTKFYVPGSVLQAAVDNTNPLAFGMSDKVDFFFENDPSFTLKPDAQAKGVKPVAWFDTDTPLRSGWGWGQGYLKDSVAVVDAQVGKGKLFVYGPEITYRGQPHSTFMFLFNGIYYGRTETVNLNDK